MPRHEPFGRPDADELLAGKVVFRRGTDGKVKAVLPDRVLGETTEAAERPPTGDDPRSGPLRDVPPMGGI